MMSSIQESLNCYICDETHEITCFLDNRYVATHQKAFTTFDRTYEIIGPDTLLYEWQKARYNKDWKEADRVKMIGKSMGLNVAFCGDRYEVHGKLY